VTPSIAEIIHKKQVSPTPSLLILMDEQLHCRFKENGQEAGIEHMKQLRVQVVRAASRPAAIQVCGDGSSSPRR
jgi:hypothetical protein